MTRVLSSMWYWLFPGKSSAVEQNAIKNIIAFVENNQHDMNKKISKGEARIRDFMKKKQIPYCREFKFPDLNGPKQNLRFDFGVVYKHRLIMIEYHGAQHFKFPNIFHRTRKEFDEQIAHDVQKREYCKKHDITLVEYDYTQDKILETLLCKQFQ